MQYRSHPLAKNERNHAMIADYLGGMSRRQVADKYGLHMGRVADVLEAHNIRLAPEERVRRHREGAKYAKPRGRPTIWPDCPPELHREYMRLRWKGVRAAEARAALDPGFKA